MTDLIPLCVTLAQELWATTLAAPSRIGRERFDRMNNPRFGDLVLVIHTARDCDPRDRIGRYDASWGVIHFDSETGEEWHETPVYGIETLDGRYMKWTNVTLIALPVDFPFIQAPNQP